MSFCSLDTCASKYNILKQGFNMEAWMLLASAALTLLQVYKRKRSGETEQLSLVAYDSKWLLAATHDPRFYDQLPEHLKAAWNEYYSFYICAKKGNDAPLLRENQIVSCTTELQRSCGILGNFKSHYWIQVKGLTNFQLLFNRNIAALFQMQ